MYILTETIEGAVTNVGVSQCSLSLQEWVYNKYPEAEWDENKTVINREGCPTTTYTFETIGEIV